MSVLEVLRAYVATPENGVPLQLVRSEVEELLEQIDAVADTAAQLVTELLEEPAS